MVTAARQMTSPTTSYRRARRLSRKAYEPQKPSYQAVSAPLRSRGRAKVAMCFCIKDGVFIDPCCGSGHFLVAALYHLVPIRMAEEGLTARQACDAVLSENLHGLEIDERCTQIAAFALALAAWTYPGAGGYRPLPELRIACSGIAPNTRKKDWVDLAGENERLRNGMARLYDLFQDAPVLGSLIDPGSAVENKTISLNSTAGCSTTGPSSGISGTGAGATVFMPWSATTGLPKAMARADRF